MIVIYPSPILRKKCHTFSKFDREARITTELLEKHLLDSKNGVGLAAPQIGKNGRIFAIKTPRLPIEFFINPKIINVFNRKKTYPQMLKPDGEREDFLEGCLSFPKLYGTVKRWLKIEVEYQDKNLTKKREVLKGFKAIVFQHERDHLDGILFVDHIKKEKGKLYREKEGGLVKISVASVIKD